MIQMLDLTCTDSALLSILSIVQKILKLIQIIAPILLMVMAAIHLIHLVAKPDDKKILKKLINSFVAAAVIFFIPMLLDGLMSVLGENTSLSSCWESTTSFGISTTYIDPYGDRDKNTFIDDPDDYEKGVPKKPSAGSTGPSASDMPSLVDDSRYDQYQTIARCDSETLKYKIINVSGQDLVIIWAQNPYQQLNLGLAAANSMGRLPAEQILSNEIQNYGYQGKCLVAVNASFFSYSTGSPIGGVVIYRGNVVKNSGNAIGCIGVDPNNNLIECSHSSADAIASKGVRNTFVISSAAGLSNSGPRASRTQICQIDQNNFVLLSGSGTVGGTAQITKNVTGCSYSYNLDGGGSRKLYYQTQGSGVVKRFGGSRTIPDMLYFAEG